MKVSKTLVVLTFFFTTLGNAQITKGNWMVGGSGSFYSQKYEILQMVQNSVVLELRPNVGYFLVDNFALGISPQFTYVNSKESESSAAIGYGTGLYARYYLLKSTKKVNILTQVGYTIFGSNSESTTTKIDLKAGPVFFFNPKVALEITLNYNKSHLSSTTTIELLSLGVGFQIHLDKIKKL